MRLVITGTWEGSTLRIVPTPGTWNGSTLHIVLTRVCREKPAWIVPSWVCREEACLGSTFLYTQVCTTLDPPLYIPGYTCLLHRVLAYLVMTYVRSRCAEREPWAHTWD